jgi:hypothetical protein
VNKKPRPSELNVLFTRLKSRQTYTVTLQDYDQQLVNNHFYVALVQSSETLAKLSAKLQEDPPVTAPGSAGHKFTYTTELTALRVNDRLEVRFDQDDAWYRTIVRELTPDHVTVYYVDFGNSQKLDVATVRATKPLRVRNFFDNEQEAELFALSYQAIRCAYMDESGSGELGVTAFLEKVSALDSYENGFVVRVCKSVGDDYAPDRFDLTSGTYGIQVVGSARDQVVTGGEAGSTQQLNEVVSQSEQHLNDDNEVSSILENSQLSVVDSNNNYEEALASYTPPDTIRPHDSLKRNESYTVIMMHVESVSEFYMQLKVDGDAIFRLQTATSTLMESVLKQEKSAAKAMQAKKGEPLYKAGDSVFAKFLYDKCWYRGVVVDVKKVRKIFLILSIIYVF